MVNRCIAVGADALYVHCLFISRASSNLETATLTRSWFRGTPAERSIDIPSSQAACSLALARPILSSLLVSSIHLSAERNHEPATYSSDTPPPPHTRHD